MAACPIVGERVADIAFEHCERFSAADEVNGVRGGIVVLAIGLLAGCVNPDAVWQPDLDELRAKYPLAWHEPHVCDSASVAAVNQAAAASGEWLDIESVAQRWLNGTGDGDLEWMGPAQQRSEGLSVRIGTTRHGELLAIRYPGGSTSFTHFLREWDVEQVDSWVGAWAQGAPKEERLQNDWRGHEDVAWWNDTLEGADGTWRVAGIQRVVDPQGIHVHMAAPLQVDGLDLAPQSVVRSRALEAFLCMFPGNVTADEAKRATEGPLLLERIDGAVGVRFWHEEDLLRRVDIDAMTSAIITAESYPYGSHRTVQDP